MDNFNLTSFFRNQYLNEAEGEEKVRIESLISSLKTTVPEGTEPEDFAVAVGAVLKDDYGKQNFNSFMNTLHAELGMESLEEELSYDLDNKELSQSLEDEFGIDNYVTMYSPTMGKIIFKVDDIRDEFEEIKKFLEGKGFKVTGSFLKSDDELRTFIKFDR
jgi:hypothetical protein